MAAIQDFKLAFCSKICCLPKRKLKLLAIYHLVSYAGSWNNCEIEQKLTATVSTAKLAYFVSLSQKICCQ